MLHAIMAAGIVPHRAAGGNHARGAAIGAAATKRVHATRGGQAASISCADGGWGRTAGGGGNAVAGTTDGAMAGPGQQELLLSQVPATLLRAFGVLFAVVALGVAAKIAAVTRARLLVNADAR